MRAVRSVMVQRSTATPPAATPVVMPAPMPVTAPTMPSNTVSASPPNHTRHRHAQPTSVLSSAPPTLAEEPFVRQSPARRQTQEVVGRSAV